MTGDRIEGPRFALVPEWVVYAGISSHAVRVYAVLARHMPNAHPGLRRVAELMGVSVDTVRRAVGELEAVGAVRVVPRRDAANPSRQLTNAWVLAGEQPVDKPPRTRATPLHPCPRPPSTGATTPLAPVLPEGEQDKEVKKGPAVLQAPRRFSSGTGFIGTADCERCDGSGWVEDTLGQFTRCASCSAGGNVVADLRPASVASVVEGSSQPPARRREVGT